VSGRRDKEQELGRRRFPFTEIYTNTHRESFNAL